MTGDVIVLGAKGRFGRAAVDAFVAANWSVRAFGRNWDGAEPNNGIQRIEGDAFDQQAVIAAARGCDVIINALNPPYPRWHSDLPRLTASILAAAKEAEATVMIPGNVYNFGQSLTPNFDVCAPQLPTTRKGQLRMTMEQAYQNAAAEDDVQTIILYGGDFIEQEKTGNWFDSQIAAKADKGKVTYPGPLDKLHAWAYLPDMAKAMVALAEKRAAFSAMERIGFPGHAMTGQQLVDAIEAATNKTQKVRGLPWPLVRLLGLIIPNMREIAEMAYLWHLPHAIDGARLSTLLPDFQPTPIGRVMADALAPSL